MGKHYNYWFFDMLAAKENEKRASKSGMYGHTFDKLRNHYELNQEDAEVLWSNQKEAEKNEWGVEVKIDEYLDGLKEFFSPLIVDAQAALEPSELIVCKHYYEEEASLGAEEMVTSSWPIPGLTCSEVFQSIDADTVFTLIDNAHRPYYKKLVAKANTETAIKKSIEDIATLGQISSGNFWVLCDKSLCSKPVLAPVTSLFTEHLSGEHYRLFSTDMKRLRNEVCMHGEKKEIDSEKYVNKILVGCKDLIGYKIRPFYPKIWDKSQNTLNTVFSRRIIRTGLKLYHAIEVQT